MSCFDLRSDGPAGGDAGVAPSLGQSGRGRPSQGNVAKWEVHLAPAVALVTEGYAHAHTHTHARVRQQMPTKTGSSGRQQMQAPPPPLGFDLRKLV